MVCGSTPDEDVKRACLTLVQDLEDALTSGVQFPKENGKMDVSSEDRTELQQLQEEYDTLSTRVGELRNSVPGNNVTKLQAHLEKLIDETEHGEIEMVEDGMELQPCEDEVVGFAEMISGLKSELGGVAHLETRFSSAIGNLKHMVMAMKEKETVQSPLRSPQSSAMMTTPQSAKNLRYLSKEGTLELD